MPVFFVRCEAAEASVEVDAEATLFDLLEAACRVFALPARAASLRVEGRDLAPDIGAPLSSVPCGADAVFDVAADAALSAFLDWVDCNPVNAKAAAALATGPTYGAGGPFSIACGCAEEASRVARVLGSPRMPEGVRVQVLCTHGRVPAVFTDALAAGHVPRRTELRFTGGLQAVTGAGVRALAKALAGGLAPEGLTVDLNGSLLGVEGAQAFAAAIASGKMPSRLTLRLCGAQFMNAGVKLLAEALMTGRGPARLTLDVRRNSYSTAAKDMAAVLLHPRAPPHLTLLY
eukprot:Rhum_TRINITY_DN11976_c0_g1::Rhum_TRINITY_DN11976_c0_g1_i1::g.48294::m.48294